jgi:hypothetical protein
MSEVVAALVMTAAKAVPGRRHTTRAASVAPLAPLVAAWGDRRRTPRGCREWAVRATKSNRAEEGTPWLHRNLKIDYLIAECISSGNVQAAVDLYEPTATFVAEPGKLVSGRRSVR